jgi:PAS domain S-box-containing protein
MGKTSAKKILLVESDKTSAKSSAGLLKKFGFGVSTVFSREEALKRIGKAQAVDLIMIGFGPGEGRYAADTASALLDIQSVPVVFLTAACGPKDIKSIGSIAHYGCIPKDAEEFIYQTSLDTAFKLFEASKKIRESQTHLQAVFEATADGLLVVDLQGRVRRRNRKFNEMWGIPDDIQDGDLDDRLLEYVKDQLADPDAFIADVQRLYASRDTRLDTLTFKDGRIFERYTQPYETETGILGRIWSFRDITERMRAETALEDTKQRLETILGITRTGVDVIDPDFNLIYVDPNWQKIYGDPQGRKCYEYFMGRGDPCPGCGIPKALETQQVQITEETLVKENNRIVEVHTIPFLDSSGQWLVAEFNVDITDRKRSEAALRESEELHRSLIDKAFDGIYLIRDRRFVYVNPRFTEITGYGLEDVSSEDFDMGILVTPQSRRVFEERYQARLRGEIIPDQYQFQIQSKDGRIKELELSTVSLGSQSHVVVLGIMRDITERKRDERKLRDALQEKDVMLREIHHRVKNNMQVISSLLRLQARVIPDPALQSALNASQERIRSMALIHEKLYKSENLSRINFGDYIRDLVNRLMFMAGGTAASVDFEIDADNVELDINQAIPCGLIVNEIVSNSLKHAFPDGRSGAVHVEMKKEEPSRLKLVIRDDGIGIPENVDIRNPSTLGLQIVSDLVGQLDGTIEIEHGKGTAFTIRF